jgi:hypothetical protein
MAIIALQVGMMPGCNSDRTCPVMRNEAMKDARCNTLVAILFLSLGLCPKDMHYFHVCVGLATQQDAILYLWGCMTGSGRKVVCAMQCIMHHTPWNALCIALCIHKIRDVPSCIKEDASEPKCIMMHAIVGVAIALHYTLCVANPDACGFMHEIGKRIK